MKKVLIFLIFLISSSVIESQTILKILNCNSLEIVSEGDSNTENTYLLEQQIIDEVWIKLKSKISINNYAVFNNLNNGFYRATCVSSDKQWNKQKEISNIVEIRCDKQDELFFDFAVVPNPTINQINIQFQEKINNPIYEYIIYNNLGEKVQQGIEKSEVTKIALNNVKNGIYYIQINVNNSFAIQKFAVAQ